jgi:uncharacterized RmlC-like cupin family protein
MLNSLYEIGNVTKISDKYEIRDDFTLENLALSSTTLTANERTNGHKHTTQDEIFIFHGTGEIYLKYPDEGQGEQEQIYGVSDGDIVSVPKGVFHQVYNRSKKHSLFYVRIMSK